MENSIFRLSALFLALVLFAGSSAAQEIMIAATPTKPHRSRIGFGVKMSSLGAGAEFAVRVTTPSNLRIGVNTFTYSRAFSTDGFAYDAEFDLLSAQINYDWFPFHGRFHLSPGVLVYNGNSFAAKLSVKDRKTFDLGNNTFISDPKDPIRGKANITFQKVAPAFLIGWGNIIPYKPHRLSFPFEFGIVYHGQPKLTFDLGGEACDKQNRGCEPITSDPKGQQDIDDERKKISRDVSAYKFYPVISGGVSYSF